MRTLYQSNPSNFPDFSPRGQCDLSGMTFPMRDLVPQYEYNGVELYDTGFLVYKGFVDEPNPSILTPPVLGDPRPVIPSRPSPFLKGR